MRLIISLAILFIFVSCNKEEKLSFLQVDDINPEKRELISVDIETFDLGEKLLSPGFFDVDNNAIYVTDFKDYGIYKGHFETETKKVLLNKIAGREGSGPGEFEDMSDIQIVGNSILVSDENSARLSEFSLDGDFKKSFVGKKFNAHRFVALDLNRIIVLSILSGDNVISIVDAEKDTLIREFYEKDEDLSPLIYEGKITANKNGQIFYSGFAEPVIIRFSKEGEKVYSVDHVDSYSSITNYLTFDVGNNSKSYKYSPTAEFYTISLASLNGLICILVKKGEDKFVDFYDSENGHYKNSIKVSSKAIELSVDNGSLYILNLTMPNTSIDKITL